MQPYKTISNDEYRAMDGWSSTQIKQVVQHSIERALIPLKDSEALQFGRAFHTYMEDPSQFLTEYAVFDDEQLIADILAKRPDISAPTMTKDYKTAKSQFDADNADKTIIGLQDFRTLERMRVETMKNPMVENLMQSYVNEPILEGSFFSTIDVPADFTGDYDDLSVLCKARPDFLAETKDGLHYMVDWKSCRDASPKGFRSDFFRFRYDVQAVFYSMVVGINPQHFYFVAIEKEEPFNVGVYNLSPETIQGAYDEVNDALRRIALYELGALAPKIQSYGEVVCL